eukprot:XP_024438920.1 protein NRT1/ PTR FAMILY 5.10-like [Populus trichocarpa]
MSGGLCNITLAYVWSLELIPWSCTVLEFSSTWKYFESVEENDILLLCVCSGVEVAESFTFDVLASNLTADLTGPPGQSNATAIEKVNARCGTASPLPLAADSVLARYLTIVVAFVIYIVARTCLVESLCYPSFSQFQRSLVLIVAVGKRGHRPCIQAFGANQFDEGRPRGERRRKLILHGGLLQRSRNMQAMEADHRTLAHEGCSSTKPFLRWIFALEKTGYAVLMKIKKRRQCQGFIPIRATNLLYAIVDAQYSTFFTMQGASKDRTIASGFIIPTATLLSFTSLTIVMLVPVFDRICPFIKSFS